MRALRSTQTAPNTTTVRDLSTYGAAANNATTAAFATAGASSWQFNPNVGGTSGGTAPAAPAGAITGRGWRDPTGDDVAEQVTYIAGNWTFRTRVNKTVMAINASVTVRVTTIIFRVTSGGAWVSEIGRAVSADMALANVGDYGNATNTITIAALTFNAADKIHVESYVENIVAGVVAAPVAAYTVALTVDDTNANLATGISAMTTYTTEYVRGLTTSLARTVVMLRLLTLTRSYSANQPRTVTLARLLTLTRSFTVDQNRTVSLVRVVSYLRSYTVDATRSVSFSRTLTLARSFSANVTRSVAFVRLLSLARSFTVDQPRTVAFARAVTTARSFVATVARTTSMRIELPQAVLNRMTPGGGGGTIIRKIFAVFDD